MEELLSVDFIKPKTTSTHGEQPKAWYVIVNVDGSYLEDEPEKNLRPIICPFSRKRDAEIGMLALMKSGLDSVDKLVEEKSRLKEIMCTALQW